MAGWSFRKWRGSESGDGPDQGRRAKRSPPFTGRKIHTPQRTRMKDQRVAKSFSKNECGGTWCTSKMRAAEADGTRFASLGNAMAACQALQPALWCKAHRSEPWDYGFTPPLYLQITVSFGFASCAMLFRVPASGKAGPFNAARAHCAKLQQRLPFRPCPVSAITSPYNRALRSVYRFWIDFRRAFPPAYQPPCIRTAVAN